MMSTRLMKNLAWVIPALPCALFWYTWFHYSTRRWAEYLLAPAMLLSALVGLGTLAGLLALRSRGALRLNEARVVAGLVLAALDIRVPVGLALAALLLIMLLAKGGGKLSF